MNKQIVLLLISLLLTTNPAFSNETIMIGDFSKHDVSSITPKNWQPLTFDSIENQTAYYLDRDENNVIFKAVSNASASGYLKKVSIDPKEFPILTWKWKIKNTLKNADINTKDGDDYPARIYITFEYDVERLSGWDSFKVDLYKSIHGEYPPLAVLNYVWDNKQPIGYSTANAYTNRVQMIVSQTGKTHVGKWVTQEANIYEDYKQAFGETPMKITAIAIMTDTDNTGESTTAYYGDIQLKKLNTKNIQ